jgi:hypothetical protein
MARALLPGTIMNVVFDDGSTGVAEPEPEACERCGSLLGPDEVLDGRCAACAEEERERNFADVEARWWDDHN